MFFEEQLAKYCEFKSYRKPVADKADTSGVESVRRWLRDLCDWQVHSVVAKGVYLNPKSTYNICPNLDPPTALNKNLVVLTWWYLESDKA